MAHRTGTGDPGRLADPATPVSRSVRLAPESQASRDIPQVIAIFFDYDDLTGEWQGKDYWPQQSQAARPDRRWSLQPAELTPTG